MKIKKEDIEKFKNDISSANLYASYTNNENQKRFYILLNGSYMIEQNHKINYYKDINKAIEVYNNALPIN